MAELSRDPAAVAAKSVYDLLLQRLRDDHGVHAETALCAAGAVTGDAIARYARADAPQGDQVDRVLAYVRERCAIFHVLLPDTDEPPAPPVAGSTREPLDLARDLGPGVVEIVSQLQLPSQDIPLVVARCIPALLSNTAAVLDSRLGYAIALQALRATAATHPVPSILS